MSNQSAKVRAGFQGISTTDETYAYWERGFIEFFGGQQPDLMGGPAKDWLKKRGMNWVTDPIDFTTAARAFHCNQFRFEGAADDPTRYMGWLKNYEAHFDRIPPEIAEDELTDEDWKKTEQYSESFDPRRPRGKRTYLPPA